MVEQMVEQMVKAPSDFEKTDWRKITMAYSFLLTEKKENVAIITINREDAMNAVDLTVLTELEDAFSAFEKDDDVRTIIITGKGKAFVAGADIAQLHRFDGQEGRDLSRYGQRVYAQIEALRKPVIAAVNGFALGGGCELAMSCDIRIASEKAKFGQPEVNLGIIPGYGGTQRLTRLVGRGMAKYLCMTAEIINAEKALTIGLVEEVVPAEQLMERALEVASLIASKAPIAVSMAKLAIGSSDDLPLAQGIAYEAELYNTTFKTEDRKEGTLAFIEKRQANFKNK